MGGYYCVIQNEFDSPAALAVDKDIRRVLTPKVSVPFFRMWCFTADCVCGVLQRNFELKALRFDWKFEINGQHNQF